MMICLICCKDGETLATQQGQEPCEAHQVPRAFCHDIVLRGTIFGHS